jgi:hypothetical protein
MRPGHQYRLAAAQKVAATGVIPLIWISRDACVRLSPPPWSVQVLDACFVVTDSAGRFTALRTRDHGNANRGLRRFSVSV